MGADASSTQVKTPITNLRLSSTLAPVSSPEQVFDGIMVWRAPAPGLPRHRDGSFEPKVVKKRQKRLTGVDEMVISLVAKGLTTGEVRAHLAEVYGAEVSRQTLHHLHHLHHHRQRKLSAE